MGAAGRMTIRILIADDHKVFREALRIMLQREPDLKIVGEAADGESVVKLAPRLAPDLVLMDIGMPGLNGIEATGRLLKKCPSVKVLGLSSYAEKYFILQMLNAGAAGYVVKTAGRGELLQGIRRVAQGKLYVSPEGVTALGETMPRRRDGAVPIPAVKLGQREREVLQLLAEGKSSGQIGVQMNIATGTVEVHRRNIMRKLNLHSVAELTKHAIRIGLTTP